MTSSRARLWVARHAPVIDGTICYGRADVAVQVAPDRAAERLIATYRGETPRHIWSSTASRCRLVAEQLAATLQVSLTTMDTLRELHFGEWEGRVWSAIQSEDRAAYEAWMNDWQGLPPPGGERPADIEARVRSWLVDLAPRDGVHWLIAHSGVVRALSVVIEGATWPEAMRRQVRHLEWTSFALTHSCR